MSLQIHWHEGLFLQPHHLQRLQKNVFDLVNDQRKLTWPYSYGVIAAELNTDALENMRIEFKVLRAIMPSGIEVDFPRNANLPSIDIKQVFATQSRGFTVYLALPLWREEHKNTIELEDDHDSRAKLIYRVKKETYGDENSDKNEKELQVRRLNARLFLENEDGSDMEKIPLVRVVHSATEDSDVPRRDLEFAPPCLFISGSSALRDIVRDLSNQIDASRKELVQQVARGGFSIDTMRGLQFEQIMRLRSLNRFAARLPSLVKAPSVTPFQWYLELRELHSELVALFPDRDEFDILDYNHDNPILCFHDLSRKIRGYLRGAVAPSFEKVDFVQTDDHLSAMFKDEHFILPNDYLLGIRTKEDSRRLAAFVEDGDKFKLMPKSIHSRVIYGVGLKEERIPPLELPARADLHYFRLDRNSTNSQRIWEAIKTEKAAAIVWKGWEDADFQVSLYMVMPSATR